MKNYSYPIDYQWSHQEMSDVIELWRAVELAYEEGIQKETFLKAYKKFKQVVPAIGEEKQWAKSFEDVSGYVLYRVVQQAKNSDKSIIKLGD